jgi:hypothetical protein
MDIDYSYSSTISIMLDLMHIRIAGKSRPEFALQAISSVAHSQAQVGQNNWPLLSQLVSYNIRISLINIGEL